MKEELVKLSATISKLKVGGKPAIVLSHKERLAAFNVARNLNYKIKTRNPISGMGFEIHRTK